MQNNEPDKGDSSLQQSFDQFVTLLDTMDPEDTDIEDIDELIAMLDEIEEKFQRS